MLAKIEILKNGITSESEAPTRQPMPCMIGTAVRDAWRVEITRGGVKKLPKKKTLWTVLNSGPSYSLRTPARGPTRWLSHITSGSCEASW